MKQEFDNYINDYRKNCDNALWLSGESSSYFAVYKAKKLKEWITLSATEARVLDFGCGDGVMTNFVSKEFPHAQAFGVDPSPASIKEAKKHDHIIFKVNSDQSTKLDFEDDYFDLIYSAGTFHHIPFDLHEGYLQELTRILKPNGQLVILELNPLNPLTVLTFKRNPIDKDAKMLSHWYANKLGRKCGKTTTIHYCFFPKFLSKLRWVERYLTKLPFGALYAAIIKKDNR